MPWGAGSARTASDIPDLRWTMAACSFRPIHLSLPIAAVVHWESVMFPNGRLNPLTPNTKNVRLDFFAYLDYKRVSKCPVSKCFFPFLQKTCNFQYLADIYNLLQIKESYNAFADFRERREWNYRNDTILAVKRLIENVGYTLLRYSVTLFRQDWELCNYLLNQIIFFYNCKIWNIGAAVTRSGSSFKKDCRGSFKIGYA